MTHPLAPLAAFRQFIAVRLVPLPNGKFDKLPLTPQGYVTPKDGGGAHNPAYWMSWAEAHALATSLGPNHTVGFVITPGCGIICLDIDGCIQADGSYTQIVHDLAAQLGPGVAWERSLSGTGLHLWMTGGLPPHAKKNTALRLELYTELRFIALGTPLAGDMTTPCPGIAAVAMRYFPPGAAAADVNWDEDYRHPDWVGPALADEEVVRLCSSIKSTGRIFGSKATFAELMEGDPSTMARYYPSDTDAFDRSSADLALFSDLAWGTGHNAAQMVRIAHTSGLAREKWDREDYLKGTVAKGVAGSGRYKAKPSAAEAHRAADAAVVKRAQEQGFTIPTVVDIAATGSFASREDQLKLFARCVLIVNNDGGDPVILMPNGSRLKRRQFEAKFAGPDFLLGGSRNKTTDSAWEAFTRSADVRHPRADRPTFRPRDPFQAIYAGQGGETLVNTYLPRGEFKEGDATPFVAHIAKILPRADDALILTSYLAACVQHPGRKFSWAVVLVSGAEGTGKGLISSVMATALGREYVKQPKAATLTKDFNAWMRDALLVVVNDMPASAPEALLEALKPMITDGEGATIEGKGVDQISADVFCNWMFTSNHKDGIRKTSTDRRYCMLFCAQDDADDLARDGMGEAYFTRFAHWLQHEGGRAIAANYLRHFDIPERYDPTKAAVRAPETSSTAEALQAGRDELSQILAVNLADGSPGFRGDWVSQTWLAHYASGMRVRPTPQKLKRTLESQGYLKPSALPDGRTNNKVQPDNAKSYLWIRKGSKTLAAIHGKSAAEIARMYEAAQADEAPTQGVRHLGAEGFLGGVANSTSRPAFGAQ